MPALIRLTRTETTLFFREPVLWLFALVFPPLLLVVLGSVPSFREPSQTFGGARAIDAYTPIIVALGLTMFALTTLPQQFATYREKGILRRMRTTPVQPGAMLGAQLTMSTALSLVSTTAVLTIARLAFDVALPGNAVAYLAAFLLTALAMFAIGLLIAAIAPGGTAASAIGMVAFFPMLFFAGLWIPRDSMSPTLRTISDFTPLGAAVQSLRDATAGHWPQLLHVAVLLGWTVLAGGLAARWFRWE